MSNTTDTSHITFVPTEIETRIDAMITEKRTVFLIITHRRSVSYSYGTLEQRLDGFFLCESPDGLSYVYFHRDDIEATGTTCIWLKP